MSLFVWYFGTRPPVPGRRRTTPSCSGRATGNCSTTSSSARCSPTISASICTARPRPIPSLAPPGCDAFYVLSPVPNLEGGQPTGRAGRALPRGASRASLEATLLPGLARQIVTSRVMTPQRFPATGCSSSRGAAFGLEPVLTQSAWFRPHNRSEDIERPVPRRRRHASGRRRARRAVLGAGSRQGGARCRAFAERLATRRRSTAHAARCCARGSRSFYAASLLLPRRVREPAYGALRLLPRSPTTPSTRRRRDRGALRRAARPAGPAYAGRPMTIPPTARFADRRARATRIPRALPEALLEGFGLGRRGARATRPSTICTPTPRASPAPSAR